MKCLCKVGFIIDQKSDIVHILFCVEFYQNISTLDYIREGLFVI